MRIMVLYLWWYQSFAEFKFIYNEFWNLEQYRVQNLLEIFKISPFFSNFNSIVFWLLYMPLWILTWFRHFSLLWASYYILILLLGS